MCILSFAQRFPNCWMLKVFMLLFYKYLCNGQYHRGLCVCMLWTTSPRYLRACCGFTACLSPPLEYENEISLVTCISWAGYGRSDGCHFGDWVKKGLWLLPCFFLGHVFWVRQLTCYRMLKQSCGEVHGVTSLQPGKWVIWEVNPLASDKPSDGCSPRHMGWLQPYQRTWTRNTQLSCSQSPNVQKLWDFLFWG